MTSTQTPVLVGDYLAAFTHRLIVDAVLSATRQHYLDLAEKFEQAKPRPDEYHGRASREDLREAWRRCDDTARALRAAANLAPLEEVGDLAALALQEVAS